MSMSINPLTSWRMQAQFWRTRRGRGGAGRRMSSFFPFLSCISSFHFFCGVTLRATKEKTGQCKTQTADCCFHRARSFHISHMTSPNSNQETIDSSEFLFSWGITAPKNLYFHEFSVPKVSSFSIEHAWISRLLGDAAFSWCWPGKFLCG